MAKEGSSKRAGQLSRQNETTEGEIKAVPKLLRQIAGPDFPHFGIAADSAHARPINPRPSH